MSDLEAPIPGRRSLTSTQRLLAVQAPLHAGWSPDGLRLSLTTSSIPLGSEDETMRFTVVDVASGVEEPMPGVGADDRIGVWSPDGSRLAVLTEQDGETLIGVIEPTGDEGASTVKVLAGSSGAVGPAVWSPDGSAVVAPCRRGEVIDRTRPYRWTRPIAAFDGLGPLEDPPQLRLIDVATGEGRWLTDDGWRWGAPRWSPDGARVAAVVSLDPTGRQTGQFLRIVDIDGTVSTVPDLPGGRTLVPAWLDDGRLIALIGEPRDLPSGSAARLVVIDARADGITMRTVPVVGDVGLLGDVYGDHPAELADSYDTVLLAVGGSDVVVRTGSRGRMGIARIDVDSGAVDVLTDGDRCCSPVAVVGDRLLFTTQSCDRNVELAVLTGLAGPGDQRAERQLSSFAAELGAQAPTVSVRRFVVDSPDGADGWPLDAWFMAPADAAPDRALPTVLVVHGGPQFAYGEAFNVDIHALCAAGFGVLYTDPRGSTGWGDDFAHAVHSDWADGPSRDVLAVVDHAIAMGWVDGDRLGVTGNSYGGYLSAWLSATTTRFRAAVIENPVTDLVSMWGTSDIGLGFFAAQFGGPPRDRMDVYVAQSPLHRAHESRTPTLFVVGEVDRRCPSAQTWAMHRVLVSVGTPSEVLVLPGSSHEGSTYGPPAARFAHDEALVSWMTRWVVADGAHGADESGGASSTGAR